jgi:hypothetical protein
VKSSIPFSEMPDYKTANYIWLSDRALGYRRWSIWRIKRWGLSTKTRTELHHK